MLTGDKVETATCIAMSAGFKSKTQSFYFIRNLKSMKKAEYMLKKFQEKALT